MSLILRPDDHRAAVITGEVVCYATGPGRRRPASPTARSGHPVPVDNVKRPKVHDESQTVELTTEELQRIFDADEAHSPRLTALV